MVDRRRFSLARETSEQHYASVEKEAHAIPEAIEKWRHYLLGRHFTLVSDQRSVCFMFDRSNHGKIKNEKILRWRINLSSFSYDIVYRKGELNAAADALSRVNCSATYSLDALKTLHESLCHPGVTRLSHFIRSKNLPYSMEDIRKVTSNCRICCELKPQFFKSKEPTSLIKATQPFERLNVDFKGPVPSISKNTYILIIVDEYSRFVFAYPCTNVSAPTIIKCFSNLFSMFGTPSYIHSDRGSSFLSQELRSFLLQRNVASSRTTPYNPEGNGLAEKYVGSVWKSITLALKSRNLSTSHWETVLPDVLHTMRSLLCTSTNCTPHERLFNFTRNSSSGCSIPSWLATPGKVLLKRQVRNSKHDPLVDEVELVEANPHYAHVRTEDGRETTVSVKHLAPYGQRDVIINETSTPAYIPIQDSARADTNEIVLAEAEKPVIRSSDAGSNEILDRSVMSESLSTDEEPVSPRRSSRISKPPDRFSP